MRLLAVKIGVGVPSEPFSGSVQSVFVNAAILIVADRLVTLAPTATGGLPGGITVDVPSGFNFAGTLTIGAAAVSRAGVIRFGGERRINRSARRDRVAKPALRPRAGPRRAGGGTRLDRGRRCFADPMAEAPPSLALAMRQ